jgi:hypothetical protein
MPQAPTEGSEPPALESPVAPDRYARPAFIAFIAAELSALVFYMTLSRPMWFYLDEWDFLANRTGGNLGDLFRAHNEHWVTIPVLVYRGMWWLVGLRSYRPYQLIIVLMHLGAAYLVRVIMRRVGVRPWTATIVACVLVFFGAGYQNIIFPFQMTLVGSLIFGLVHLLLASHDGPLDRRDYWGLGAGLAGLMCSGVGVSMVIAVGAAVLIARGWRLALLHTVPLGVVYVVWYAAIGHVGYTGYRAGPGQILSFLRTFIAAGFSSIGHNRGLGFLLGVLLVVGLIVAWRPLDGAEFRRRAAMPLGLLVGALALLAITGFGRAGIAGFAEKSRYLHLVAALTLPALGVAADAVMVRSKSKWVSVAVIAAFVVPIPANLNVMVNYMHKGIIKNQVPYKAMMLTLPRVPIAKDVPRRIKPDQLLAHFVTIGWLLDGVKSGRIPKPSSLTQANAAMATLRLSFLQEPAKLEQGDVCVNLSKPLIFSLKPGQRVVVRAPNTTIRVLPASENVDGTYPWLFVTFGGSTLVAVRPVQFQLANVRAPYAQACTRGYIARAARIAGAKAFAAGGG